MVKSNFKCKKCGNTCGFEYYNLDGVLTTVCVDCFIDQHNNSEFRDILKELSIDRVY
jgi:NMD protein affecting ribosome stability and mRNA decay